MKLYTILVLTALSTAWHLPLAVRETSATTNAPPRTLSEEVKSSATANPTAVTATSSRSGLGGPSKPLTATEFLTPSATFDWSTIVTADLVNLVAPPAPTTNFNSTKVRKSRDASLIEKQPLLENRTVANAVDWRNYYGLNWLTSVQDQGRCGSCWTFAAVALAETQARIEHGVWNKRSEADLHDQMGWNCIQGGWVDVALDYSFNNGLGIADVQCDVYTQDDQPWSTCDDRVGRSLKFPEWTGLWDITDQKAWLNQVGPLAACFSVFNDFYSFNFASGQAYKYDETSSYVGGHCILIVGYDDDVGGWLFRNSWSPSFGMNGYGYISYGTAAIDVWEKFGINNMGLDPWVKKRHHNGNLYESRNGVTHRNFELLRANTGNGLQIVHRDGEVPFSWHLDGNLFDSLTVYGQPTITGSSFSDDLEVVYVTTTGALAHWYFSQRKNDWLFAGYDNGFWDGQQHYGPIYFYQSLQGYPGFAQTDDSSFSLVVRTSDGSLREYTRNAETGHWALDAISVISAADTIKQSGPALVQSNVGLDIYDESSQGNLYVVAVLKTGEMQLFWRSAAQENETSWVPSEVFGSCIGDTPPVMIQDFWRTKDERTAGGFQLLVAVDGQVQHWQRVNTDIDTNTPSSDGPGPWTHVLTFGSNIKHAWGLVHGSFAHSLEAVVEDNNGDMWHWQFTNAGWVQMSQVPGVAVP